MVGPPPVVDMVDPSCVNRTFFEGIKCSVPKTSANEKDLPPNVVAPLIDHCSCTSGITYCKIYRFLFLHLGV